MPRRRTVELGVVGTLAGLFSGVFGVGGGSVIVPLLVLRHGYGEREATGTSLAAIVLVAAAGAAVQAVYGNVHVLDAVAIGLPAVAGVVAGTALQQRVPQRLLAGLFAALLIAVAVDLALK